MTMKEDDTKDLEQFQYNVTIPHIEHFKRRNKVDVAREKLVDRVKKFKRQAPRVGDLIQDNPAQLNQLKLADEDHIDQNLNEQVQQISRLKFAYSRNNYSEMVQQSKFFERIKKYHQEHYNGPILSFSSISNPSEEDEDSVLSDTQQKKRRFLKRRKRVIMHDQGSSSVSSSSFKNYTNDRRRKLMSSISNQHKKRRVQLQLLVNGQRQKIKDERLEIRHRMMNFVIPADWTCITGPKDNTTKSRDFLSHELMIDQLLRNIQNQKSNIEHQMEKIEKNKIIIQKYKQKIMKLNQNLNRLSLPTANTINSKSDVEEEFDNLEEHNANKATKSNGGEAIVSSYNQYPSSHLSKNSYLLKQAYRHHRKLVRKIEKYRHRMNLGIRLECLQVKVQQSLQKQTSLLQRWTFPIGLLLIITLSFFILLQT